MEEVQRVEHTGFWMIVVTWWRGISLPDLSFHVSLMTSMISDASENELLYCNKVLRQVQLSPMEIKFQRIDISSMILLAYCDSSFKNLPNGGSQGG